MTQPQDDYKPLKLHGDKKINITDDQNTTCEWGFIFKNMILSDNILQSANCS